VVRTHPETLRDCLFVSSNFTTGIVGLDEKESDDLLGQIFAVSQQEGGSHIYIHRWRQGDMLLWVSK